jgi:hypothetical protein
MLLFVTSLRSPANARDYGQVERLLLQTLGAIDHQTNREYRVVIVGNQEPSFTLPDQVEYVGVTWPAPEAEHGVHASRAAFVRDKGTKIGLGLSVARKWNPDYAMIVDADDLVSRRLTEFVQSSEPCDGWYVETGYKYSARKQAIQTLGGFNRWCGSCHIVRYGVYEAPELSMDATQGDVIDGFGETRLDLIGRHRDGLERFADIGVRLSPMPFRAVAYTVDAGENHSETELSGLARPVSAHFAREFSIERTRPMVPTAIDSFGPVAITQTVTALARRSARSVITRSGLSRQRRR